MSISDLSSKDAILQAIHEFDDVGRESFLRKYGFAPSRKYLLFYDFALYDTRPVIAAAHGFQFPDLGPLKPREFKGRDKAVHRKLESMGFTIHATSKGRFPFDRLAFLHGIPTFEKELHVPDGFLSGLIEEDDWSFVVKLHALIEAAIARMLTSRLDESRLDNIIATMPLSDFRTGKIAYVQSLGLLPVEHRRWIQKLSELRNDCVHDVANVNMSLSEYFSNLPASASKGYRKAFCWGYSDASEITMQVSEDLFDARAVIMGLAVISWAYVQKITIWLGGILLIREIYEATEVGRFEAAMSRIERQMLRILHEAFSRSESA
jgi:hypothetical protein